MATFTFDRTNLLIIVDTPDTEVTIQELWNAIQDYQDELTSIDLDEIANASGKQDLGGGVNVGITLELNGGWRVQFEDRGSETICTVSGGNLVGKDLDLDTPYFPLAYSTFVLASRSVSSSATLLDQIALQASLFDGRVCVDAINGTSGTTFPQGTLGSPVDNLTDAKIIAVEHGLDFLRIMSDFTIANNESIDEYTLESFHDGHHILTLTAGCSTQGSHFRGLYIMGTASGDATFTNCVLNTTSGIEGLIKDCGLDSETTLTGSGQIDFINCYSKVPGMGTPTINMNGSGRSMSLRGYMGGIRIKNFTDANENISIDLVSGQAVIDSTVTAGTIVVRGVGRITDNSTGGTINIDNLVDQRVMTMTNKYLINKMSIDTTSRAPAVYAQIWDDAGTTVLYEHRLLDPTGGDPSVDATAISDRGDQTVI